jgi:hypothetical protein
VSLFKWRNDMTKDYRDKLRPDPRFPLTDHKGDTWVKRQGKGGAA